MIPLAESVVNHKRCREKHKQRAVPLCKELKGVSQGKYLPICQLFVHKSYKHQKCEMRNETRGCMSLLRKTFTAALIFIFCLEVNMSC